MKLYSRKFEHWPSWVLQDFQVLQGHQDRRVKLACQDLQDMMEKRGHEVNQEKWGPLVPKDLLEMMDLQERREKLASWELQEQKEKRGRLERLVHQVLMA